MKNKSNKNKNILLYNINTSKGLNKKCNIPLTFLLIYINILLSFYEDNIDFQCIYHFFNSFLCVELGLNIHDVINEINTNTKLQRLQDLLTKRKIDINFFEEDMYNDEIIKYVDGDYIYKDNINITIDVNKSLLSKRKYKKYEKSKQNK